MKRTALRTLELVIRSLPAYDLRLVAVVGQELVEHVVVRIGCATRHACHGMSHQYIYLSRVLVAANYAIERSVLSASSKKPERFGVRLVSDGFSTYHGSFFSPSQ
ncbi:hypothetical protein BN903_8 [Halorubrum sp. AJ67]|nr:hypothetical protein BN903_8 [Halorubrum sp. AJ67]